MTPTAKGHARETAEEAYRRIARRKLRERAVPDDRMEATLDEIMKTDVPFRFDPAAFPKVRAI